MGAEQRWKGWVGAQQGLPGACITFGITTAGKAPGVLVERRGSMGWFFLGILVLGTLLPVSVPCLGWGDTEMLAWGAVGTGQWCQ